MPNNTIFFVVDFPTDRTREIFTTEEEARQFAEANKSDYPKIFLSEVKNAYQEDGEWNYEDFADTFNDIKEII